MPPLKKKEMNIIFSGPGWGFYGLMAKKKKKIIKGQGIYPWHLLVGEVHSFGRIGTIMTVFIYIFCDR